MIGIKVLVVENDPLVRITIIDALEDHRFQVHEAATASSALDMLYCDVEADCLVIEVELGSGMDGLKLASSVRKKWPDMGIVLVSGKSQVMPPDVPNARFLIKPYDPTTIAGVIRELVAAS